MPVFVLAIQSNYRAAVSPHLTAYTVASPAPSSGKSAEQVYRVSEPGPGSGPPKPGRGNGRLYTPAEANSGASFFLARHGRVEKGARPRGGGGKLGLR